MKRKTFILTVDKDERFSTDELREFISTELERCWIEYDFYTKGEDPRGTPLKPELVRYCRTRKD